ncbi:uncharacterized protein [Rutidosis leptorrhynchoides]|uniref:uncharacterized protein n=1 Tax=Rutidosis leptorrhynchoides TaxID=125765 RepID=UPI003A9A5078
MAKCGFSFNNSFARVIGEGRGISFWKDHWIGDQRLRDKFPRLYRLEEVKDVKLCDRVTWSGTSLTFRWQWIRSPFGRNSGEINEIKTIVAGTVRSNNASDGWKWLPSDDGRFNTRRLTEIIDDKLHGSAGSDMETMRSKLVPKSLGIFVWRAKRRRLPVRVELDNRGIDLHTVRCPVCDDDVESTDHALILCKFATEVWERVFRWWGHGSFSAINTSEIFNGGGSNISGSKGKALWQAVEWVCGYQLWKNRNQKVFHNNLRSSETLFNDIQIKSYEWISKRDKNLNLEWHQWLINPSYYGNSGNIRTGVG